MSENSGERSDKWMPPSRAKMERICDERDVLRARVEELEQANAPLNAALDVEKAALGYKVDRVTCELEAERHNCGIHRKSANESRAEVARLRGLHGDIQKALDYSLNHIAEKECDSIVWKANMRAYGMTQVALNPPVKP